MAWSKPKSIAQAVRSCFSHGVAGLISQARGQVEANYALKPGNNVNLICQKLADPELPEGVYAECGVFQGTTLFTVAAFLKNMGSGRRLVGFDSFEGFPGSEIDYRDAPEFFGELLDKDMITEEHYRKAAERTADFTDSHHLTGEYFLDVKGVFDIAERFENVRLVKGSFSDSLKDFDEPIAVLFLDCDLYQSYIDCLGALYELVIPGGVVIFDEYYSLKYPGACWAVAEFFAGREGTFEVYHTDEGFERWCFVKPH
ncbi:MAG: class I SAM-dependent methyltransferase [Phycisphaerae bacterium]|nr:class I SAM-dependent methyltransferase [Phycisphaerae bacterium]